MSTATTRRLSLSAVTDELQSYRQLLADDLEPLPNLMVKVLETIKKYNPGSTTLEKLDDYIKTCDAIVHLIGDATGKPARKAAVDRIRARYPNLLDKVPVLREPRAQTPRFRALPPLPVGRRPRPATTAAPAVCVGRRPGTA
jgi:hypothetical protein